MDFDGIRSIIEHRPGCPFLSKIFEGFTSIRLSVRHILSLAD